VNSATVTAGPYTVTDYGWAPYRDIILHGDHYSHSGDHHRVCGFSYLLAQMQSTKEPKALGSYTVTAGRSDFKEQYNETG